MEPSYFSHHGTIHMRTGKQRFNLEFFTGDNPKQWTRWLPWAEFVTTLVDTLPQDLHRSKWFMVGLHQF